MTILNNKKNIKLVILGKPQAQERPKFRRSNFGVVTYDPPKSKIYKKMIRQTYVAKFGRRKIEKGAPTEIQANIFREVPKSFSKKKREQCLANEIYPVQKPDTDNYIKIALDGLNGLAFDDDNQVTKISAAKYFSDTPRLEIEINEMYKE